MAKVYIVGLAKNYMNFIHDSELTDNMEDADIVLFTGGEDVHPQFYNEEKGKYTSCNLARDLFEINEFKKAKKLNKFCLGICRGFQFLTVMSGGELVQHVTNHGTPHEIEFEDGEVLNITSTHHQMCYPFNLPREDYSLIAWSKDKRSTTYLNGNNSEKELPEDFKEPEIVFYYNTNCLGIQGHPEFMDQEIHNRLITKLNKLINDCKNYSLEGVR